MKKSALMFKCLLAMLLLSGCGSPPRTVVVVSMDGFRHDYHQRVETPHFDRLAQEGAHAERIIPPFPSQTFPSHATLATGVSAGRHGILNNRFSDRKRGLFHYADHASWYQSVPLWIHAERHGMRAKIFHWIGSRGAYEGVSPSEAMLFDKKNKVPDDQKVERMLKWLAAEDRPRLLMSYWAGCDNPGHETGPDSEETTECIAASDTRLGRLMAGIGRLEGEITLLVVSDHGMTNSQGSVNVVGAMKDAGIKAEVVASGPIAHVYLAEPSDLKAAQAALTGLHHATVHVGTALPEAWGYMHPDRTGDLVVQSDFGWYISELPFPILPGHHGHDPEHPEMGGIFYAWGPGVSAGATLKRARAVDLFPTVCALLGLPIPDGLDGARLPILE